MLEPLGAAVVSRLHPNVGEHVLDVGCGCGATTMSLAAIVGPGGKVTGIDTSVAMIDIGRQGAAAAELANVEFVEGDAGANHFGPRSYDIIFSRLGTMFFDGPEAAFANLRRALRPGGRLGFVCWRSVEENAWTAEPRAAASSMVPLPPVPGPESPGPFSLADPERISELLSHASFVDVTIEPLDEDLLIGRGDIDEAIDFYLRLLPTGYLLFEPDHHLLDRLRAMLRSVLADHVGDDGLVRLGSASWVVSAH